MKKFLVKFIVLMVMLLPHQLMAQYIIHGKVIDVAGSPLVGATVLVSDLSGVGCNTDTAGRFSITLPDGVSHVLEASYIGYFPSVKSVDKKSSNVLFVLQEDAQMLEQVVITGTRTPKLLKDAPVVTRVIGVEDIKKIDVTNVGDLLQTELPGIEFTCAMNQQSALNMNGFGGNSVLFLVDGERLAGETLDNIDYSRLNLDNVERIEIVKGAASSLYGSNAIGGVINVISRDAREPWGVKLNAKYGSHNNQQYGLSLNFSNKLLSSSTNFQYTAKDDIDLSRYASSQSVGDFNTIYGARTMNFKERLVYKPINMIELVGRAGYFFRERNSSKAQYERYRSLNGGLKATCHFSPVDLLEVSYSFDQYDKSDFLLSSRSDIRDYSNVQHSVRTAYNHTFLSKHILTLGADYLRDYLMSYQFVNQGYHIQHSADFFAQFDWNPIKSFNMTVGGRFDYFSASKLWRLSPKVNAMYKFSNCSLRASYAGGFRAPTLKEMYMNFDMSGIFMIYGNPDLKAENSHNFSLSAEYLKRYYNVTVTAFHNIVNHRITTAWNQALRGQVYTNMERLWVTGVDINASMKLPCGVGARVSYAYTHELIKKGQPQLSSTRPHSLTARVSYDKNWKAYGLSISLNGRYLSKVTTEEYSSTTSYEQTEIRTYPGYTIWKLNTSHRVWRGINITASVDNIFNYRPKYYYSNSPLTTGTTFSVGMVVSVEQMFNKKNNSI